MSVDLYSSVVGLADPDGVSSADIAAAKQAVDEARLKGATSLAAPSGKVVAIIGPDGKTVGIDAAHLDAALQRGYRLETDLEKDTRGYADHIQNSLGGYGGALYSGAYRMVDTGLFGAYDPLVKAASEPEYVKLGREKLMHDNKGAGYVGDALGFGASMLYGGPLFKGAAAAGTAAEGAIAGAGSSLGRRIVGSAVGGAVEGGIFSAPKAAVEFVTGNPDKAGETIVYGFGAGALFGLAGPVAGALKGKAASAYGAVERGVAEAEGGLVSKGKTWLKDKIDDTTISAIDPTQKFAKKFAQAGTGESAAIIRAKNLMPEVAETAEAWSARAEAEANKIGQAKGDFIEKHSAAALKTPGEELGWKLAPVFGELETAYAGFKGVGKEGLASKTRDRIVKLVEVAKKEGGATVADLWTIEKEMGKEVNWSALASKEEQSWNSAVADLRDKVGELIDQRITESPIGKDAVAELQTLNREYRVARNVADAADHNVGRGLSNRRHSLTDYLGNLMGGVVGTAVGGPLGSIVGGYAGGKINEVARKYGPGMFVRAMGETGAINPGLEAASESVIAQLDTIPSLLTGAANGNSVARPASAAAGQHFLTSFLGLSSKDRASKTDAFTNFADEITSLTSDPVRMQARLAELVGPLSHEHPEEAAAAARVACTAAKTIQDALPKRPSVVSPFEPSTWAPSDAQMSKLGKVVETTVHPFSVLTKMANKTISKIEVDTLKQVYPQLYDAMVTRVVEFGASGKAKTLPYQQRLSLSQLFGKPIDRSVKNQGNFQRAFAATHDPGKGGPKPGAMTAPDLGTAVQRISST